MYLLKFLAIITLLLFPLGELLRIELGNNIVLKPLDLVVGLISVVWIILFFFKRLEIINKEYVKWLIPFPIIGLVSLLLSTSWLQMIEFFTSFLYLIRWVSYALLVLIFLQFDANFKKNIQKLLLIDGLVIVLAGYVQYFFYQNLRNLYYLGWDEHMYRMFSVFLDPNFAGAFFVLYFFFVGGKFYQSLQNKYRKGSLIFGSILLVTLIAIFLTYSRSALLMLIAGSITFLLLIDRKKLIFVLVGILLVFFVIISPMSHIENTNLLRVASSEARVETAHNALKIIQDNPVLGVGFNAYRYAQIKYGFRDSEPLYVSHADAGVDNSLLFILATTGILGLMAYLSLWYFIMKKAIFHYKKKSDVVALVVIASLVGLFVNAFFINSLFFSPIMLWMWLLILPLF